jgi:hypothetical protein
VIRILSAGHEVEGNLQKLYYFSQTVEVSGRKYSRDDTGKNIDTFLNLKLSTKGYASCAVPKIKVFL